MRSWRRERGTKLDRFVIWRLVKHSRRAVKKIRSGTNKLRKCRQKHIV